MNGIGQLATINDIGVGKD
uniref:Uncharacterized protein n=1 Tax=Nymphaea colorata TaxID=210225 RepID=A0A5K1AV59_9MAGN